MKRSKLNAVPAQVPTATEQPHEYWWGKALTPTVISSAKIQNVDGWPLYKYSFCNVLIIRRPYSISSL